MLKGKTALVTGSTSGIGLALALAMADAGANVVINGLGEPGTISEIERKLRDKGVQALFHGADMTQPRQIADLINTAQAKFGSVDIVINNAGIQHVSPVEDFPVERWDAVIAINLSAAFHTTRLALPKMRANNWGRIINISSAHGLVASANKSAYVAAKHGLLGLTKTVALETATTGVTCNAICPGWVLTPLVQKQIDARAAQEKVDVATAKRELLAEKQPSLEFVSDQQIAALAVFLCSDAASQVRGAAWNMDGGWCAQ